MEEKQEISSRKRRSFESRSISPPPLRRKLYSTTTHANTTSVHSQSVSHPPEPQKRFEIISWNVNGVGPLLSSQTPKITSFFKQTQSHAHSQTEKLTTTTHPYSLRSFLKRHNYPQVLCLQEVKIASSDESTKRALERAANSDASAHSGKVDEGPTYAAHFSLPRDRFNARGFGGKGKVYGVCTLIRDDLPSPHPPRSTNDANAGVTTREVEWDLEGRVLVTELSAFKLAIMNGYWVNGTSNPYRDPATGAVRGIRHDFKRAFHALMLDEVHRYEERGWWVVLIGDVNIARAPRDGYPGIRLGSEHVRNRREFNEMFFESEAGMRGVDTWRYLHGDEARGYTYHGEKAEEWGRSCDRVDLAIVSRRLVHEDAALVQADIWESVLERGHSDHVPIGVVLDLGKLEGTDFSSD